MQDIESYVMSNYQENMLYFEQKHHSLWKKLKALEVLLGEGKYPQKYDLEYKNDYFDVIDLSSGACLYNTNSNSYSQAMVDDVNHKKDEHTIETFYNFNFDEESVQNARKLSANHTHAVTAPIISYYNNNIKKSMLMKKIYKFIFLGVGLGLHLEKMAKKTDADVFFVVENDIELFRLSLFTCNYKNIFSKRELFFSVAQNLNEFNASFISFYEYAFIRNHYLKFSLFSSKDEIHIKNIQAAILTRSEHCYSHAALLEKGRRVLDKLPENYKFLSMLKKDDEFFKDKPILVLGAGPSLGANKEWLIQNHDKFIIIAPFVTLRVLYHLGIAPDILVHIDEGDEVAIRDIKLYEGKSKFFDNSLFIFNASVPEIFFETFRKESIYLIEDRTHYKLNDNYIEIASVGETVYAIALSLSNSDIYMLGLDLSVSQDGMTHTKTHATKNSVDTTSANKVDEGADLRKSVFEVKGNFREKTYTIPLFSMSINMMNRQTGKYKSQNQKVYNLSDGAYFEGTVPLHTEDVEIEKGSLREFGAVHTDYYHTYFGYCKSTDDKEIFDVDVILDGEVIETLRADKNLDKVADKFDIEGYGFEFYLDEKYFDKPHFLEFKSHGNGVELVNSRIETVSKDNIKYNEYRFLDSLSKPVNEEKTKNLYCKDAIGFLAVDENLKDKAFISYIKELYARFPQAAFKAFYFNDEQRIILDMLFDKEKYNIDYIGGIKNIGEAAREIEIFVTATVPDFRKVVEPLIFDFKNIVPVVYSKSYKNTLIGELSIDLSRCKEFNKKVEQGYSVYDIAFGKQSQEWSSGVKMHDVEYFKKIEMVLCDDGVKSNIKQLLRCLW